MKEYKYHLELTALYKLLGDTPESLHQLIQFHILRNQSLSFQLTQTYTHLETSLISDRNRQQQEESVIRKTAYTNSDALIDALLDNGLLPL
jgi:hypothetical protein